jgi:hypothetical protein
MVVENEDGDIPLQALAYDIEKIISVKNAYFMMPPYGI